MKTSKGASTKTTRYRIIGRLEKIRVIHIDATPEDEAVEIALEQPIVDFELIQSRFQLEGIRPLDDKTPVRFFKPIVHSPRCHEEY